MSNLLRYFWKKYFDSIEEFREKKCKQYCFICGDNCCNGRLNPAFSKRGLFKDLKVIRYKWHKPPSGEPYLVDRRLLGIGSIFLVNECPFLKDNLCVVHENPLRPSQCTDYPLYLDCALGIPFLKPFISVECSCRIFHYKKNISEVEMFAKKLGLDIVFHRYDEIKVIDPNHGIS